jgi:glycerol kinase
VGITNQRETTVVWDKETGEPLYNAIVWTDTRTQALVRKLKSRLGSDKLQDLCGLPLSTYPSVGKLLWLLENEPKVSDAYERGVLCFGTIDAWLVYKLNGGPKKNVLVSDPTNASRTMFMNIHNLQYDESLIDFFRLDRAKLNLPKIVKSSHSKDYGSLASGPLKGTLITGCLGDQSAALVGQKGFSPGMAKNTYGTGCFLLYNVGEKPVISKHGLLATVAYDFEGGKPIYALEGSIAVAGSSIKFLVNNFKFIESSDKISQLASEVEDSGGCTFVTAFSGLFAPYWIDDARGTICEFHHIQSKRLIFNCDRSWHNAIHATRPRRPRHVGSNLLPNQSHPRRDGEGQRPYPERTRCRRRDEQFRSDDAGESPNLISAV